jgi:hypothetical protein
MFKYPVWLKTDEEIIKTYRRHFIPIFFQISTIVLAIFPFVVLLFIVKGFIPFKIKLIVIILLFLIVILSVIYTFCIYWSNKLIITNERLLHVEWFSLTRKKIHDIELQNIQLIDIEDSGIINKLFPFLDYGNIEVLGSSDIDHIIFNQASNPAKIKRTLNKIIIQTARPNNNNYAQK